MSNGGIAGLNMDITALKKAEAQRDYLAYQRRHRPGCRTRRVFTDRLGQALRPDRELRRRVWRSPAWSWSRSTTFATASGLEAGRHRHPRGRADASGIRSLASETVAHIGGGQFLVLCVRIENDAAAMIIDGKVPAAAGRSVSRSDGQEVPLRIAIGVSIAPGDTHRTRGDHPQRHHRNAQGEEPADTALPVLQSPK